jgi:hypothetical protein
LRPASNADSGRKGCSQAPSSGSWARQRLTEHAGDLLEIDELDRLGGHGPRGVLVEADDGDGQTLGDELVDGLLEVLAVRGGDDEAPQDALRVPTPDVRQHVRVDVGVLVGLRLGEHGETDVAQRLHPRADDVRAAGGDVGEHGGLGLDAAARLMGQLAGAGQQPAADGVETRAVGGGRAATEDGSQAHVQVGGVPDEEEVLRPGRILGAVVVGGFVKVAHGGTLFGSTGKIRNYRRCAATGTR